MKDIATDPRNPAKPCEYFDMIGGTSTGGLIAIMLGRLHMSVDECLAAYRKLSDEVFQAKHYAAAPWWTFPWNWELKGRFDTEALERAIKSLVVEQLRKRPENRDNSAFFRFVTATSKAYPDQTTNLTSYPSERWPSERLHSVKIWEAARATSAASTFFDPIAVGTDREVFLDGATGANNPVRQVASEARDVWSLKNIGDDLQCFISIGTGVPSVKAFGSTLKTVVETLKDMSTETERTAESFLQEHTDLDSDRRLFRFNVEQGLEDIGLEESQKQYLIAAATYRYLARERPLKEVKACVETMKLRQCIEDFS
ncbi:acyl transferase/acyl hydrolase/lysophospholipase [Rhexocercosporidium sp. MPI-PUGE-AT-0058]|nr:acyl transferase/acyl hydrolase/lysophospholipase [Rhexocercosporidium sp. MPI-PUGE-AT-0058]